jgi:hypothetical protein
MVQQLIMDAGMGHGLKEWHAQPSMIDENLNYRCDDFWTTTGTN